MIKLKSGIFLAKQIGWGYEGEIETIERWIAEKQVELEKAKRSQAARDLIKLNGWDHFDVSDDVDDYEREKYFDFVGTQEERDKVFSLNYTVGEKS